MWLDMFFLIVVQTDIMCVACTGTSVQKTSSSLAKEVQRHAQGEINLDVDGQAQNKNY